MAKRNKKRNRRHDAAFKNLYAFRLMAWGLMEVALPRGLFEELDFDTLEHLPAEWIAPGLERRLGDTVWRVRRRGGGRLIVPVEFQRKPDRLMPLRVAAYVSLMLENLARRGELDPGGRLPLVKPVVLYNGLRPWRWPTGLSADGDAEWPRFALVDMGRIRVEDLPRHNAAALQIEVHQGALARDADGVLGRLSALLGGPAHRGLRLAFAERIWHSLAPGLGPESPKVPGLRARLREIAELGEFEEMKSFMLKSMVDHWLEQGMARGLEQGVARGMEQGMEQGVERGVTEGLARARADERARLCRLAGRKFGGRAADQLSARIDGVTDPARLAEVGDWIIDCDTEAEFLARAGAAR